MKPPPRRHRRLSAGLAGLLVVALAVAQTAAAARAEEVRIEHLGLALLGNVALPAGRKLADDRVVLLVHGALAHHGMEIVATLQRNLAARGVASLAVTLSLGLDARRGMRDCALEHDHRASDASDEIAAWVHWLDEKGAASIVLAGHSRGAEQIARYAAGGRSPRVSAAVLIAPPSETAGAAAARYREAHGGDLPALLAAAGKLVEEGDEDSMLDAPGFLSCKGARVTAGAFLDYYRADEAKTALALAPGLGMPVLVIAGTADTVSPGVAARLAAVAPAGNVTLRVVDGADHFFRDLFADELAEHVAAFVVSGARN